MSGYPSATACWAPAGRDWSKCQDLLVFVAATPLRDRWCPHRSAPSFFVCTRGTRLDVHNLSSTFAGLVDLAGITVAPRRRRPRLHDLRHAFAVATLVDVYRAAATCRRGCRCCRPGSDTATRSHLLVSESVPELLALAADRVNATDRRSGS